MKRKNKYTGFSGFCFFWVGESLSLFGSALTKFALILWVYEQKGTASNIAFLSLFTYLPSILFSFIAGSLSDRWDKKRTLLWCNLANAIGTLLILTVFLMGNLHIWHVYVINFSLSFVAAFQNPATNVSISLLAPKEKYTKVSGMQSMSNSLIGILAPSAAAGLMAFNGLPMILVCDGISFFVILLTLYFCIEIPSDTQSEDHKKVSFIHNCMEGVHFLRKNKGILFLILFFSFINFLAYLTGYGILPALILSRSGNNTALFGVVSSFIGIGTLVGSIIVTFSPAPKDRIRMIFLPLALSFLLANAIWAVGQSPFLWIFAAFAGNLPIPFVTANLVTIMRTEVPTSMQGRVFSTRDTLQFFTIPIGLSLSGVLGDFVFEPFMQTPSYFQQLLSLLVGHGKGSGIGLMFLITGTVGCLSSLIAWRNKALDHLRG